MKTNKTMALGIVLLIGSPMMVRSAISQEQRAPSMIQEHIMHKEYVRSTPVGAHVDPSDDEILARAQFGNEYKNETTYYGWPKVRVSSKPFSEWSKYYRARATVDRQGAASQVNSKHID